MRHGMGLGSGITSDGGHRLLELYHHNISVCAQKVRLSLFEKGLVWKEHHIDLMKAEQVSPEYLAINPKGVVPTIVHDGHPVIESTVILEYLEEAFPEKPLRPADPLARAHMRVWAKIPDDGLHMACGTLSYAAAFADQVAAFHGRASLDARLAKLPDRARAARQAELFDNRLEAWFVPEHVRLYHKVLGDLGSGPVPPALARRGRLQPRRMRDPALCVAPGAAQPGRHVGRQAEPRGLARARQGEAELEARDGSLPTGRHA